MKYTPPDLEKIKFWTGDDEPAVPQIENKIQNGCQEVLRAYGAQDHWMLEASDDDLQLERQFSREKHVKRFAKLDCELKKSEKWLQFTLSRQCDAINGLALVIKDHSDILLDKLFDRIDVEIGGQRFDCFCGDDIETMIDSVGALWRKKIRRIGNKIFVPLCMAPFHEPHNFNFIGSLAYHERV